MKRVCVVQVRMGSTRLPSKAGHMIAGHPLLSHQLRRLRACASVDEVVVATTTSRADDAVAAIAARDGHRVFRGSEHDVLGRVTGAARAAVADVVIRVTGDCPLIDPSVVDTVVDVLVENESTCDYASNVLKRTYPRGLDAEAMFIDTLCRMDRLAATAEEREHVTLMPRSTQPGLFLTRSIEDTVDNSDLRWTVDHAADLELVRRLFDSLPLADAIVPYAKIVAHLREHPELAAINADARTWTPTPSPSHNSHGDAR